MFLRKHSKPGGLIIRKFMQESACLSFQGKGNTGTVLFKLLFWPSRLSGMMLGDDIYIQEGS